MTNESKESCTWKVYVHITPSNKKYVGITSRDVKKRWNGGLGYKSCTSFYRAIQKYGWDNIEHKILEDELSFEEAERKEQFYIEKYQSNNPNYGYNMTIGGLGSNGFRLSVEKKKVLSNKRQGINAVGYGFFPSDETKQKMSDKAKGRKLNKLSREKMSNIKKKPVYQYDLHGNFIQRFDSAIQAADKFGINRGNLCSCCRNVMKSAGGYFWSYEVIHNPELIRNHLNGVQCFPIIKGRNEKPVYKLDLFGNMIERYESIKSASIDTGIPSQEISQACKNKNKVTREFKWKYAESNNS